jgi:SH3-like domain-containing protein
MQQARPLFALTLGLCLLLPLMSAAHAREMVSTKERVNMRAGGGKQHEALWVLDAGYPLSVVGRRGAWLKVTDFEGDSGWVYRPLTGKSPHHIVKVEVANIRKTPDTGARIVGKATYGELLRTLRQRSGWVQVRTVEGGVTGWIAKRLLWGW